MAIQALLWDVGGVLLRTEDHGPRRKWEDRLGLPAGQLAGAVFDCPTAQRAAVGDASEADVWRDAAVTLGIPPAELDQFKSDFFSGDRWDEKLLQCIQDLHPPLKMGILSNAWTGARETFRCWINPERFDAILFSGEEHMCKPDERIYQLAAARLGLSTADILFIDDFLVNVEGARRAGMMAIHFQNPESVITYVKKVAIQAN
jgi:glucose-1-phosphatase